MRQGIVRSPARGHGRELENDRGSYRTSRRGREGRSRMAKGKHATALFEVIHSGKKFDQPAARKGVLATPKWWFKSRGKSSSTPNAPAPATAVAPSPIATLAPS